MILKPYQKDFLDFVIATQALRFGTFILKSGRESPYFFNTGLFNSGASLARLGQFYAAAIIDNAPPFDMIFGPAYKGIPLAVATTIALATQYQRDIPYAFNRKEAKDHGEGGIIVGAPLKGRVLIIDDVISSGLSIGESIGMIAKAGAQPVGVVIAMDRQEKGQGALSAAQEVHHRHGIPVSAIATLEHLLAYLAASPVHADVMGRIQEYRRVYGC